MDIWKILKKIEETETPQVNKGAVAYSGGLDSSLAIKTTGFDQRRCADAAYIRGLPFEILAKRETQQEIIG